MNLFKATALDWSSFKVALLPLGLWIMLWLSLAAGDVTQIYRPGSLMDFGQGLRAVLPLVVAALAIVIIFLKLSRQHTRGFLFFGPLGLAAVYGIVGVIASIHSPKVPVALYWAFAYLSVPLVLWAIVWETDTLDRISRLVNLNWFIICLFAMALFTLGLLYLDLGSIILNPSAWSECKLYGTWHILTSNFVRSTGVARYAGIAGILALSWLWRPGSWRFVGAFILLVALILLLTSGGKTAFVAFAVAAPLVVLLYGGKRAAIAGVVILLALIPLVLTTGVLQSQLEGCILGTGWKQVLRGVTVQERVLPEVPVQERVLPEVPVQERVLLEVPVQERTRTRVVYLSGRTAVWAEGWQLFKRSPLLGFGFHADRLLLKQHMHNAFMHALVQTGLIGTIPLMAALVLGWVLLFKALRNLVRLPADHKHLVIQTAGIMTFLSIRAITESTGAFFGVDWLLLGPLLLYLQVLSRTLAKGERPA